MKKGFLKNFAKFTGKHLHQSLIFKKVAAHRPATLLKKRLAQGFSGEFCEFFKNTFFTEHLWATASDCWTSTKRVSYLQSFLLTEMQT